MEKFASLGVEILKRSVLQELYDQYHDSTPVNYLHQDDIRDRAGIPPQKPGQVCVTRSVLNLLKADEYVKDVPHRSKRWSQITEEGISVIEGSA